MKKYILFATALIGLLACSKEMVSNVEPEVLGETITLTASIDFDAPETRVAPNDTNSYGAGYNVAFHWQEGDTVLLTNFSDYSKFALKAGSISPDGMTAQFIGKALPDMSSYTAFYAGKNTDVVTCSAVFSGSDSTTTVALDNVADGCNVVAVGMNGNADGFTLSMFLNTFRLKLTGDVTLGKVEYLYDYDGTSETPLSVINFGTDGLALTSTAQEVWIPATLVPTQRATFRFYDKVGTLIMSKAKAKNFNSYSANGNLISFPELEVKAIPVFSVSATKKVKFTKGNLYWNGSEWKLEDNQTDYPTTWDQNHVGHFFWTKTAAASYAASYSYDTRATSDKFFADGGDADHTLTVDGQSGLYVLSSAEWDYLINSRTNASSLYKYGVTVTDGGTSYSNCLIIAPDGYSETLQASYTLDEVNASDLVCLPAAGGRENSTLDGLSYGGYSSATPHNSDKQLSYYLLFNNSTIIPTKEVDRKYGLSIRLVHNAN